MFASYRLKRMESVSIKHDEDHAVPPLFGRGKEAKECCTLGGSNIVAVGRSLAGNQAATLLEYQDIAG